MSRKIQPQLNSANFFQIYFTPSSKRIMLASFTLIFGILIAVLLGGVLNENPLEVGFWIITLILPGLVVLRLRRYVLGPKYRFSQNDFFSLFAILFFLAALFLVCSMFFRVYNHSLFVTVFNITFSVLFCVSLLLAVYKARYFIDLNMRELVLMESLSVIPHYLKETRFKHEVLKEGTIGWVGDSRFGSFMLVLEVLPKGKIRLPTPMGGGGLYKLNLVALYLMKYLELPITSLSYKSTGISSQSLSSENFKSQEEFPHQIAEVDLTSLGWRKVSDTPFTLQGSRKGRRIDIVGIFCFLILFPGALDAWFLYLLLHGQFDTLEPFGILFLLAIPISLLVLLLGLILFVIQFRKRLVRVDKNGLQAGLTILGGSIWSVQWPYKFIRALTIKKNKKLIQVSVDFFLDSEVLAEFRSKEDAQKFQIFLGSVCGIYQKLESTLN